MTRRTSLDRRAAERRTLARLAGQAERAQLAAALAGPQGAAFRDLRAFLRELGPGDGRRLVEHVEASEVRIAVAQSRIVALRLITAAIGRVKARAGLPDNDPLPGQPESARQACARLLRGEV